MTGIKKRLGNLLGPKGNKGDKGDQGDRGLPGPDALPTDEAVSTYIMEPNTASRAALDNVLEDSINDFGTIRSQDFTNIVLGTAPDDYLPPGTIAFYYTPTPTLFTDFSDGIIGETPNGWSSKWSDHGWVLEQVDSSNVLSVSVPSGDLRSGLSWDAIQDVPGFDGNNGEIVFKWKAPAGFSVPMRALLCGSGDIGEESGYDGAVRNTAHAQFCKLDQGPRTYIGPQLAVIENQNWNITRIRKHGDTLLGKNWASTDPEPQEWQIDTTDPDFTNGWWGLVARGYAGSPSVSLQVDWVGFAAEGHEAPKGLS